MATENKNPMEVKKDLIKGDEFEKALNEAAEVKNSNISQCKERDKHNYSGYYEIMLGSRVDVQEAMNKKGKNKTDEDKELVKRFRKEISQSYRQICDLIVPEEIEEGEETKVTKMCKRIVAVVKMMRYLGHTEIEDEFGKNGISLDFKSLEEENEMFAQEHIRETMSSIFEQGKAIRVDLNSANEEIKTEIYESSVPVDLQYDKECNPTGIKSSDFCKLVEMKARLLNAKDDEEKEKVRDAVEKIAGEYVFQNARNDIINSKMTELTI